MNTPLLQRRWVLLLLAFICIGCAEENSLEGSLTEFYDVSFDRVRARLYPTELAIEYARDNGEVPVRITVRREPALSSGSFDLAMRGDVSGRSGDSDIPPLLGGSLDIAEFSDQPGSVISGSFAATFQTGEDTTSLRGDFETELEVIDHVEGYDNDDWPPGQSCDKAIEATGGGTFLGTLYPTISDEITTSCSPVDMPQPDQILHFRTEEEGRVTIDFVLAANASGALYSEACGVEGQFVICLQESQNGVGRYREELPAGDYYIILEGDGDWQVTVNTP